MASWFCQLCRLLYLGWQRILVFYCRFLGFRYSCQCGHPAKWKTTLTIHGHLGIYTIRENQPKYCPECWAKAAIKCAWCGETIRPGDPITLYTPKPGVKLPEHAVVYRYIPHLQVVGCLGWNCAETGADRAGFWIMPGKVQRVMSPLEMLLSQAGAEVMIIDLADPSQAVPFPRFEPSKN